MNDPNEHRGKVVLFEGMDGAGKSTLVKAVQAAYEAKAYGVRVLPFPSHDGAVGNFIRSKIFTGEEVVDGKAMAPLMLADAIDCEGMMIEARNECDVVLVDRHTIVSMWAYQLGHWPVAAVARLGDPAWFEVLPDVVFILDVPAEVAVERMRARGGEVNPLYEKGTEYAELLRERYACWAGLHATNAPVCILDGTKATSTLVAEVLDVIS